MDTEKQSSSEPSEPDLERRGRGALGFARRHPALSVIGAAGVGLFGGVELAAGVLLGAGVASLLRRGGWPVAEHRNVDGRFEYRAPEARPMDGQASASRERARRRFARAQREIEKRARAVVRAVRGKVSAEDERQGSREPSPMPPPAV